MRSIKPKHHKDPTLVLFGKTVRAFRKEAGYSQEAFGDLCGIDRSYMGGIERGEHNITLLNIIKIMVALGCEPSLFFKSLDASTVAEINQRIRSEQEHKALSSKHQSSLNEPTPPPEAL